MDRITIRVEELKSYERLHHIAMSVVTLADSLDSDTVIINRDLWQDLKTACREVNSRPGETK